MSVETTGDNASLDGALGSGRRAAEAVLLDLGRCGRAQRSFHARSFASQSLRSDASFSSAHFTSGASCFAE